MTEAWRTTAACHEHGCQQIVTMTMARQRKIEGVDAIYTMGELACGDRYSAVMSRRNFDLVRARAR